MPIAKKSPGTKLIVPATKKRNPLVAPAITRKAGAHRKSAGAIRQKEELAVKKKIAQE
jgi:hypothetical protein